MAWESGGKDFRFSISKTAVGVQEWTVAVSIQLAQRALGTAKRKTSASHSGAEGQPQEPGSGGTVLF